MKPVTLSPAQWEIVERVVAEAKSRRSDVTDEPEDGEDHEDENKNLNHVPGTLSSRSEAHTV